MERSQFLALGSAFTLTGAVPTALPAPPNELNRVDRALVLSGGGARGAYQAGIIDALATSRGIVDGAPLAPYGIICGTSIGALNGYFAATGQYSALRDLWHTVAGEKIVRLKHRYAPIVEASAGVATRIAAAVRLVKGVATHERGVMDGDRVRAWLADRIDPGRRVLMPLVWTVTNLSTQSAEFFYLIDRQLSSVARTRATQILRDIVGPKTVLREATPDLLIDALRASVAAPVAFDPVELPRADGSAVDLYLDGGIIANTPIAAARAAARNVDVVLLYPAVERDTYRNALEIASAVFGAMQRRILESDLRAAFLLGGVNLSQLQPKNVLPVDTFAFDQREQLNETYKLGFEAGLHGFQAYSLA